jgi:iron complex outermembrane receptor protein
MSRLNLMTGSAIVACVASMSASACAQEARDFDISRGALGDALNAFATQSDQQLFFGGDLVAGLRTDGLRGRFSSRAALTRLLAGTGLSWSEPRPGVLYLRREERATGPAEVSEVEDVVVTGSLLRGSGELASPVLVLDRDALDSRGSGTVAEALAALPQNYAGTSTPVVQASGADRAGSNTVFATGINLRGLGPTSTLTLVNGRRLAGAGNRAEFSDVSALPSGAVERVDILLDGASALYGSDAIAGVVNVILRRAFDGQETRVRVAAGRGGAEDLMASHLAGRSWSSGSAYLSYEYQKSHALSSLDRDFTRDGDLRPFGGTDHRALNGVPGNILLFNAATSSYQSLFAIRPGLSGTAQGPSDFVAGAANLASINAGGDLVPAFERHSVYARASQTLGDRLDLSADLRFNQRDYALDGGANSGVFTVTRANPWFVSPTGAASHTIGYSFLRDLGPLRQSGRARSLGVTAGFDYALPADWSVGGYLAYAEERAEIGVRNRTHSRLVNEALGTVADDPATPFSVASDGYLNLFGDGTRNSRAVLDFISSGFSEGLQTGRSRSANLLVRGPVGSLPGGTVDLAVGASWREEGFEARTRTFISTVAPVVTDTPERNRELAAVFAELRAPIVGEGNRRRGLYSLELSLAGRWERYDDFGETRNPKLGIVWGATEALRLRASWGRSFRAPALSQIADPTSFSAPFLNRADGSRVLALFLTGGNADLQPETADTFSSGFVYAPRGGLRLSLDYFDTAFSDRIAQPVAENVNGVLFDRDLAAFVTLVNPATNPADRALLQTYAAAANFPTTYPLDSYAAVVDARWVNTGAVTVRGLDLAGTYPMAWGGTRLVADASASWILDYDSRPTPSAASRKIVGLSGYPVRLRIRAGLTWSRGTFGASLHWNHVAAYQDRVGAGIDAWDTADAQLFWTPSLSGAINGVQVRLSAQNLFDQDPPFYDAASGFGFDAGQASLLGRVVSLQLVQRW